MPNRVLDRSLPSLALTFVVFTDTVGAQTPVHPLFAEDAPLDVVITGPLRELSRDGRDRPEHDATFELLDADGGPSLLDVEIRIRGNSRLDICDFPPVRLDFRRGQLDGTILEGQNRLKLVTLCKRSDRYREYLVQEFLVYRIFNALTDLSFRVRWLNVEYVYTDSRRPESFVEPGFLIEEEWEVAERHGLEIIEVERPSLAALDPAHTTLLSLFQFLIANTDWAPTDGPGDDPCCHNGKIVGHEDGPMFVLPYDFDQAGLINTEYASPNPNLRIRSVRNRLYRGLCVMNSELGAGIARFNAARSEINDILNDERIEARTRERTQEFVDEFYEIVNDPEELEDQIIGRCRS